MDLTMNSFPGFFPRKAVGESSQTMQEFLCDREGSFIQEEDAEISVCAARVLLYFVIVPIIALGIPANLVVLWVWSSQPGYHPTTYLFKAQALTDFLTVIFTLIWSFQRDTLMKVVVVYSLAQTFEQMGVQITMLLAVARAIKVFHPLHSQKLLSRFRIKLVLAGFAVFNLTLSQLGSYWIIAEELELIALYTVTVPPLTLFIPATLQTICMTAVVWGVWRSFRIRPSSDRRTVSFQLDKDKARRVVYTVFVMCVFTFIAHVVGAVVLVFANASGKGTVLNSYVILIRASFIIASAINVSINIVIYYFFIVQFKALLIQKYWNIRHNLVSRSNFFSSSTDITVAEGHNMATNPRDSVIPPSTPPTVLKEGSGSFNTSIT